jgi:DNA-binding transcriptional MerR regulator
MKRRMRSTHPSGTTSSTRLPKYTIGIVSQILGLPPQALRRYEAAGLLEPARQTGKNRLYSDQDVAILQEIVQLSEQGVNAVGIRYILQMRQQIILLQQQVKQAREEGEEAGEERE